MKTYKTIDAYIKGYPTASQQILQKIRVTIQKAAPKAEEAVKYGIPTFVLNKNLVHFGAYKKHIGFYPASSGVSAFKKDIAKYQSGKGTIQFQLDKPIPYALITKIVKFRVKEDMGKLKVVKNKHEKHI